MDALIAGGGTGGHLFPGIAVAQELRRRDSNCRILFVGTARGIEVRAVPKAGFELALLPVSGLRRTGAWAMLKGIARLPLAMGRAVSVVRGFKPDVAISCGGYAAGPAVLASSMLGIPSVVMEQNAIPGFTNRLLGRVANKVFASLPVQGFAPDKVSLLGNPVRQGFRSLDASYDPQRPLRLLVFGGSQGAKALNDVMLELLPLLESTGTRLSIVHQTGRAELQRVQDGYAAYIAGGRAEHVDVCAFIDDMPAAYSSADLVLCRSGATTIAELTACGRPSLLVPYPAAVDDHQTANAKTLEAAGGAIHIAQPELSAEGLLRAVSELSEEPGHARLRGMATAALAAGHPDAAEKIVDALQVLCAGEGA